MSYGVTKINGRWFVTDPEGKVVEDAGSFSTKEEAEAEAGRRNADLEEPPKG